MTRIELELHDDVISTILKLKSLNEAGVELVIPEGSPIFESIINLKLIKKEVEKQNGTVHFVTHDDTGNALLLMLEGDEEATSIVSPEQDEKDSVQKISKKIPFKKFKLAIPFTLPMPKFKIQSPKPALIGLFLAAGVFGASLWLTKTQKATATIKVAAQTLTRSLTVKVASNTYDNTQTKTVKGTVLTASIEQTVETDTTGEKTVGEKAKGKAKIYNNTDSEKKFKKNAELNYEKDDENFIYLLAEDVTVPERTITSTAPPQSIITWGEVTVDVIAYDIGSKYNLSDGKTLEVKGQKSSEFTAKIVEELKGGKSEKIKVVGEADLKKLKEDATASATKQAETELAKKTGKGQELIEGSIKTTLAKETYTKKVDEQADKVSLTATATADGLTFMKTDLDNLIDTTVAELIPEGYTLSTKDKEIKAEPLGNSSTSVMTSTETDLQVTIKTFVIPSINIDELKSDLKGKSAKDAEKVLASVKNIKGYSLNMRPSVPLFNKIPKDTAQIEIVIEKEE